MKKKNYFKSSL